MLFEPSLPGGFQYRSDFVTRDEERNLVSTIQRLEFQQVEMRGGVARRRTVHYGWQYGYYARRTEPGPPLPEFLLWLRGRAAEWAGIEAGLFVEALVTEYPRGAPIGWHRDAPQFGDMIAGVSLLGPSRMKFRPYVSPGDLVPGAAPRRTTHEITLEPRSAYLMTGAARREFEHHIPAVAALRYSITFRTLRQT
jgi:alkylated DNA repair dioxygenase AlkB